jgi:lysophospholipase L1-like esterase
VISLKLVALAVVLGAIGMLAVQTSAQSGLTWVTAWTASAHGPYPSGNPSAQPNLSFAFPTPASGARDQTLRLILKPDVWGPETRIRLTNAFGTRPVTFGQVHVGLQMSGAAVVPGSNQAVTFRGASTVTVAPGTTVWSDAVRLGFVGAARVGDLEGRKLAVSLHIVGESGPMTWHAKALTTSYLTRPGAGARGDDPTDAAFPFTTTSWFFVDAVDMRMPAGTSLVVALGDSITDGTGTTLNGDDRWTDGLSRRLHREFGQRVAVVNAGIGGNQVTGPADYSPEKPVPGGPSALSRLDRDVLSLSGVSTIIWFEGINDLNRNANTPVETITAAMAEGVRRMRAGIPGVRVIGGTVLSALGSTNGAHGSPAQDVERRRLNTFIRTSGLFDAVIDFDAATIDEATGRLRAEFVPDSTTGGPGDSLHPNRAGYLAMAGSIDLGILAIGK